MGGLSGCWVVGATTWLGPTKGRWWAGGEKKARWNKRKGSLEQKEGLAGTGGEGMLVGRAGEGVVLRCQELVGGERGRRGVVGSVVQGRKVEDRCFITVR